MLDDMIIAELLTHYPVFQKVPAQLQHTMCEVGHYAQYPDEQVLFQKETSCCDFVMPLSGVIQVKTTTESGREILLYRVQPGDSCIITVSCLLGNTTYMAYGIAEGKLRAVSIPKPLFTQLIKKSDAFRTFVFQFFGQRLTQLTTLIEEIAFQKLDQRLASRLLELGPDIEVTHHNLAIELGSVREVVSRLLQDFREQGAIELERGRIKIVDEAVLGQIAHQPS